MLAIFYEPQLSAAADAAYT